MGPGDQPGPLQVLCPIGGRLVALWEIRSSAIQSW